MVGLGSGIKLSPIRAESDGAPACLGKYLSYILAGCGSTTGVECKQNTYYEVPFVLGSGPLPLILPCLKAVGKQGKQWILAIVIMVLQSINVAPLRDVPANNGPLPTIFNSSTSVNSIWIVRS
ncbi:hypothetical protein IFM46972_01799 [Aspergillus udagawae]|uniref:Uncharacterized protein n=1 Tax=Aspergillus udagawae TaxID=91492 RepID=A0A8H3N9P2_9EURO|nr:hypothetical protein IFM46972_01799 [Aspergillus udagawae]